MSASSIGDLQHSKLVELPPADRPLLLLTTNQGKPVVEYGKFAHVLSGVIVCGYCRDLGYSFEDSAMAARLAQARNQRKTKGEQDYVGSLRCGKGYGTPAGLRHPLFALGEHRIVPQWDEYLARIVRLPVDGRHLATWRSARGGATEIAQVDQMEAAIRERRALILSELGHGSDEAVKRQIRAALRDLDEDDGKLQAFKAQATPPPAVDEDALRIILKRYASVYAAAAPKEKNGLNRALVAALGSMPSVKRLGELGKNPGITRGADIIFRWPEVDAILDAAG